MLHRYLAELPLYAVTLAVAVFLHASFQETFVGTDLAQTISVSQNLVQGHGLSTSLPYYEVHYQLGSAPVPQTVFPPGYSLLLVPWAFAGTNLIKASFLVSLVSWVVTALLVAKTISVLTESRVLAATGSVVWGLLAVNWAIVLEARSEALFIAAATGCLYCVARWDSDSSGSFVPWMLGAAVLAGTAFLVRYQGIFLIAAINLVFLLRVIRGFDRRNDSKNFGLLAAVTGLPVLLIFSRNLVLTGQLGGGPIATVNDAAGVGRVLSVAYYEMSRIAGFSWSGLRDIQLAEVLLLMAAAGLLTYAVKYRPRVSLVASVWRSLTFRVCAAYIAVTVIALAYLGLTKSADYVQSRYLATIIPPVIIIASIVAKSAGEGSRINRRFSLPLVVIVGLAFFAGQFNAARAQLRDVEEGWGLREIREIIKTRVDGNSVEEFLKTAIDRGQNVLAYRSQITGLAIDRTVYGLPPALISDRIFDGNEVLAMASEHRVEYILMYPHLYDPSASQNSNRRIFSRLASTDIPGWLEPVLVTDEILLFRIPGDYDSTAEVEISRRTP